MAQSKSKDKFEARLSAIESELKILKNSRTKESIPPNRPDIEQQHFVLKAHFGRVALERMPFVVTLGGVVRTLSTIRAAILLVLLMDLLERSIGGGEVQDSLTRVKLALSKISPENEKGSSEDAIRAALYRASQFVNEEFSLSVDGDVSFLVKNGELIILQNDVEVDPVNIDVEITTSDHVVSSFLDQTLVTSPLARLRKAKALYVSGGDDGQDRLLMELLDHQHPVKQTTLFYRPTIQSFPQALLHKMNISGRRLKRQEVAARGLRKGQLQYLEIIPRKCLWDLARLVREKDSSTYLNELSVSDKVQLINQLQFLVRSEPTFELVLTDAFLPFYLTTVEIDRSDESERFVLFFQHNEQNNMREVSMFALKDNSVYFNSHDRIIKWVLGHPTSIRSRENVLKELEAIKEAILENSENPSISLTKRSNRPLEPSLSDVIEKSIVQKEVVASPKKKGHEKDGSRANRP